MKLTAHKQYSFTSTVTVMSVIYDGDRMVVTSMSSDLFKNQNCLWKKKWEKRKDKMFLTLSRRWSFQCKSRTRVQITQIYSNRLRFLDSPCLEPTVPTTPLSHWVLSHLLPKIFFEKVWQGLPGYERWGKVPNGRESLIPVPNSPSFPSYTTLSWGKWKKVSVKTKWD